MKDNENANKARQRMIERMYHNDAGDDDIEWITTKTGQHVPLKDGKAIGGPLKGEDFSNAASKKSESEKSTKKSGNNSGSAPSSTGASEYDYDADVKAFSEGKIRKKDLLDKTVSAKSKASSATAKQYKALYECARETEDASQAYKDIMNTSRFSDDEKVEQIQAKVDRLSDLLDDCTDTNLQGVYQKSIERGRRIIDRMKSGTLNSKSEPSGSSSTGGGKSRDNIRDATKHSGRQAITYAISRCVDKEPSLEDLLDISRYDYMQITPQKSLSDKAATGIVNIINSARKNEHALFEKYESRGLFAPDDISGDCIVCMLCLTPVGYNISLKNGSVYKKTGEEEYSLNGKKIDDNDMLEILRDEEVSSISKAKSSKKLSEVPKDSAFYGFNTGTKKVSVGKLVEAEQNCEESIKEGQKAWQAYTKLIDSICKAYGDDESMYDYIDAAMDRLNEKYKYNHDFEDAFDAYF